MIKFLGKKFYTEGLGLPEACPVCGGDLVVTDGGEVKCTNPECHQKLVHRIARFFLVTDIKGAGPAFYEAAADDCKNISTFYDKLCSMKVEVYNQWAGGINGEKVLEEYKRKATKPMSPAKYLSLFDMEGFGETKLEKIQDIFPENCWSEDLQLQKTAFAEIPSTLGKKKIPSMSIETQAELAEDMTALLDSIIHVLDYFGPAIAASKAKEASTTGKLSGKSFCFHGKLSKSRKVLEAKVVELGGTIGAVNKNLSFLVCNEQNDGSNKTKLAIKNGVKMITEAEFEAMIG